MAGWHGGSWYLDEGRERYYSCLFLVKGMYGNPDSASRFFKANKKQLLTMGMKQSHADPCVFFKHNNKGELWLMAVIHVDDTLLTGSPEVLAWYKKGIGEHFDYMDNGKLHKHLGVTYEWLKTKMVSPAL